MKTSDAIDEISKSMSAAQGEMKPASKSTENPFFKSKYSSLAQIMESIREPFRKNGLSIFQDVSSNANGISVCTRVCHSSGQWIEVGPLEVPVARKDAQGVGSATSYGKRYSLSAAVGVVSEEEDDDAESCMNRNEPKTKESKKLDNIPKITKEELKKILDIKDSCDPKYIETVLSHMQKLGCNGFENLHSLMYARVIKGLMENSKIYNHENN